MAKRDFSANVEAGTVRTAMGDDVTHPVDDARVDRLGPIDAGDAANATYSFISGFSVPREDAYHTPDEVIPTGISSTTPAARLPSIRRGTHATRR